MTIKTNFFDGATSYGASDLIAPWGSLLTNGVYNVGSGALNVLAHSPANLSVDVPPGACAINGYYVKSDAVVNVSIASNTSGYNRVDNIVVKVDTTSKTSTIVAVQGTPSSSPVAPVLGVNQLLLAQVLVGNNVSVLNQNVITDMRLNVDTYTQQNNNIYRQALINGNFDIWQRGTSFTQTNANAGYTADRWTNTINNGDTVTITQQLFVNGQTEVPNNPKYFLRKTHTSYTNGYSNLIQKIEDVNTFAGSTITLSLYARSSVSMNINVIFQQNFGSGGSSGLTSSNNSITLTTTFTKYTVTYNVPSVGGMTIGANSFFAVLFQVPTATTGSYFDIAQVQLNVGTTALPFSPKSYSDELRACQRYYYRCGSDYAVWTKLGMGMCTTSSIAIVVVPFQVKMRVAPTLSNSSGLCLILPGGGAAAITGMYLDAASDYNYAISVVSAGLTPGYSTLLASYNTNSSWLAFDAEL